MVHADTSTPGSFVKKISMEACSKLSSLVQDAGRRPEDPWLGDRAHHYHVPSFMPQLGGKWHKQLHVITQVLPMVPMQAKVESDK